MATLSETAFKRAVSAKNSRTLFGYWRAGILIQGALGREETTYGKEAMAGIERQFKGLMGAATIYQARWLAKHWTEPEIKGAERNGIPYHIALRLTFFASESRKLDRAGHHRKATQCRAAFDRLRRTRGLTVSAIQAEKAHLMQNAQPSSQRRRLKQGRDGIELALRKIKDRIEADAALAGSTESVLRSLKRLTKDVQAWYDHATSKMS